MRYYYNYNLFPRLCFLLQKSLVCQWMWECSDTCFHSFLVPHAGRVVHGIDGSDSLFCIWAPCSRAEWCILNLLQCGNSSRRAHSGGLLWLKHWCGLVGGRAAIWMREDGFRNSALFLWSSEAGEFHSNIKYPPEIQKSNDSFMKNRSISQLT